MFVGKIENVSAYEGNLIFCASHIFRAPLRMNGHVPFLPALMELLLINKLFLVQQACRLLFHFNVKFLEPCFLNWCAHNYFMSFKEEVRLQRLVGAQHMLHQAQHQTGSKATIVSNSVSLSLFFLTLKHIHKHFPKRCRKETRKNKKTFNCCFEFIPQNNYEFSLMVFTKGSGFKSRTSPQFEMAWLQNHKNKGRHVGFGNQVAVFYLSKTRPTKRNKL